MTWQEEKLLQNDGLSTKEPEPVKNNYPAVWDLVIKDIQDRDQFGQKKYNTRLQPFNGRNVLRDLYQELLDSVVYVRQLIFEQENRNSTS
jgi:hypothetical protein